MRSALLLAALAGSAIAVPAQAQTAREGGDWLVRLRGILVSPTEDSGPVTPGFPGSEVGVSDSFMPEVDFTYMATPNLGFELILATTNHEVTGRGSLEPVGELADTWVLPPTLTMQYHFLPEGRVHPYLGAGVNYTIFYSTNASDALEGAIGATSIEMDDSFGYALQAGIDFDISDTVFVNADVKYIDIDTTATLRTGAAVNTVDVSIDPVVAAIGLGIRF